MVFVSHLIPVLRDNFRALVLHILYPPSRGTLTVISCNRNGLGAYDLYHEEQQTLTLLTTSTEAPVFVQDYEEMQSKTQSPFVKSHPPL